LSFPISHVANDERYYGHERNQIADISHKHRSDSFAAVLGDSLLPVLVGQLRNRQPNASNDQNRLLDRMGLVAAICCAVGAVLVV
jgi:hypothetical protein